MKILDTAGTLELVDTGVRCSVRNLRILLVRCTKKCSGDGQVLHEGLVSAFWAMSKATGGYHHGCDPKSEWNTDPVGTRARHDAQRAAMLAQRGEPEGACVACGTIECAGVRVPKEPRA